MTTLFNVWTKADGQPFTRSYCSLAFCNAEMVAVCLGIDQEIFTAYANDEQRSLLGPGLSIKHVAITKNIYPFDVPAVPLEEQICYQEVPPMNANWSRNHSLQPLFQRGVSNI